MIQDGQSQWIEILGNPQLAYDVQDLFFQSTSSYVYLIHFQQPLKKRNGVKVQHYLGWTPNLDNRIRKHRHKRTKDGAAILRYLNREGISWSVSKVWRANYCFEQYLKQKKKSFAKYCPICCGIPF